MVDLVAASPMSGLELTVGGVTLAEVELGPLTSIAPYRGQMPALSEAMKAAHGLGFPDPNRSTVHKGARALWFGREMALLAGVGPDSGLSAFAAMTDQSDAWACATLSGEGIEDVLARLVPLDVRPSVFRQGHTARSLIGHMTGSVTRVAADRILLMVFRSMAGTLHHELERAMESCATRG